ncbi:MAG: 4-hydroxy-tetrahydrodipicolinate reductase [Proteobacteria bacterium]|nr:4-hydroxy-tetrahydrodipicolinate reductase [Pseudomonadota bacterium]
MAIRVCIAGVSGWTGKLIANYLERDSKLKLVSGISRTYAGKTVRDILPDKHNLEVPVYGNIDDVPKNSVDVLVDFTHPESVFDRSIAALNVGMNVVIGTSGLNAEQYASIEKLALKVNLGVIAAGNFSITAALAKHFSLLAAKHLPSWEIIDYASASKVDAPSGTTRELAEEMSSIAQNQVARKIESVVGYREARGATIGGTQVHSVRLPSFTISFETIFGLPDERLTIRHDSGTSAEPYVGGTLLAIKKVVEVKGLVRGMDRILFE